MSDKDAPNSAAPDDDDRELGETQVALRQIPDGIRRAAFWFSVAFALLHIFMNALGAPLLQFIDWIGLNLGISLGDHLGRQIMRALALPDPQIKNAIHFAGFALLCAIFYPLTTRDRVRDSKSLLWLDIGIGVLAGASVLFFILQENAIYDRGVRLTGVEWAAGLLGIALGMELVRRTTGWIIPFLVVIALSYATWLGPLIPGVLNFAGITYETLLFRSMLGDSGMVGTIADISSGVVVMFIIFGAFLVRSGAGQFILDLSRIIAGKLVGGPGLVAVISSGLTGTISGSAVANTAQTGTITIPLMKRSGFPPKFSAGVEAAASTGGQLMPPIMGAGAFVMQNYTGIPYTTIIAVAALPAILYFLSIAFYVRVEAKRQNVKAETAQDLKLGEVMRQGGMSFLLPIAVLIGLLVQGFTPTYAAGVAIIAVIVGSWFTPNAMNFRAVCEALALGMRNMTMTAVLLVVIGLLVNVIPTTGVANTLSIMITEWAGGNLLIALILVAVASLVLGMGLPVTAAYIVLAVLSAPALYGLIVQGQLIELIANGALPEAARMTFMLADPEAVTKLAAPLPLEEAESLIAATPQEILNIVRDQAISADHLLFALLSAHMIIFWLSQDSNVTPPVCLTAFTAAAIASTPPMATGFSSWKIAKGLYIIPLLFAYTPFLGGETFEVMQIFLFAILGLYAFTAGIQGHLESPLNPVLRLVAFAAAAALLWPNDILVHFVGAAVFIALFAYSVLQDRRTRTA